ncbi:MAG TPA: hypothetical protein VMF89_32320 [Polyangiales bacterium]|nr:hypothetical protein [Polyangiales bacterium]
MRRSILTITLATLLGACGDDASEPSPSTDSGTAPAADGGTAPTDPVYAVLSVPATAMGAPATSYLILTDKLTGELKTEDAAKEIAGNALIAGPAGGKRLFLGTSMGGLLERHDLNADGTLEKTGELNFEAKQVQNFTSYASNFQFVDEHKAYFLALSAAKLVIWDPEGLKLTGEVALPELVREDPGNPGTNYTTNVTGAPLRHGDKLYFFTSWDSRTAGTIKVAPAATAIVIDTKTDDVKVIVDEGTCGYTRDGVVAGDWIYLVTEGAGTAVHYLNKDNGAAPCIRRFNIASQEFDADYKPDLNELAGGPAGSLVVSPEGQSLIYVLDTEAADPMIGPEMGKISNPRFLAIAAVWKTARLTVGDEPSVETLDLPLASGSVLPHVLKGDLKVTATFDEQPELREVTDNGVVATDRANAKLYGNTSSIVQLR